MLKSGAMFRRDEVSAERQQDIFRATPFTWYFMMNHV
jgi:hypothetical protein